LKLLPCPPSRMPDKMNFLIHEMLRNPYGENLRDFYYQNCIRELLFFHLTQHHQPIPGKLEDRDIAAIYHADSIISSNLHQHFTIDKLSRMTGTNQFKLKKGFKQLFENSVVAFVNEHRLNEAKRLIYEGEKNMSTIAYELGYAHPQHFQRAFKKKFGVTPGSLLK